jgi:hypothetical protein
MYPCAPGLPTFPQDTSDSSYGRAAMLLQLSPQRTRLFGLVD